MIMTTTHSTQRLASAPITGVYGGRTGRSGGGGPWVSRSASVASTSAAAAHRGPLPAECLAGSASLAFKYASLPGHGSQAGGASSLVGSRLPSLSPPTSASPRLDSMSFTPEELASQLTLLDCPAFQAIAPEELVSCSWNKKNKLEVAPNVVAFIRRFNHVAFWSTQEILRYESSVKARAEVMAHFIRTAKKLQELNNLNAEFAIISALQSASIFRLSKTWSHVPRKEKQTFDKLADLFSERDNFARLRDHMNAIALKHDPCLPYLGLYLTDLVYIDMAHPHSGGLESQQRRFKMNNILRIVSELQQSNYSNLPVIPKCQQYLKSIQYIDELQKFIEEDHYKLSLKLEPNPNQQPNSVPSSSSSKESVHSFRDPGLMAELNLSPAKGNCCIRSVKPAFVPGHRKSRSDGANIFLSCGGSATQNDDGPPWSNSGTLSSAESDERFKHHLLDDSLLEEPFLGASSNPSPDGLSYDLSEKATLADTNTVATANNAPLGPGSRCSFQGCVKRKTLIKEGRRPTVSSWQRYWLQIWESALVFFLPKTLTKGTERKDFRSEPYKFKSILGWIVMVADTTTDNLSFQLTDPFQKSVYRFRAPTPELARTWVHCLHMSTKGIDPEGTPKNLITFE
ncbi:hypothetical protein TCAL_03611 [Tigriopus californicus]|uniref:Ras-GEF domain-containing protein n=1 Tax=Tigriopus californicus TaxID=6832 RepID=A0A553NE38_TIGCA|nr:ras-specific guanine nucleotide-releasing factor RalGPS2-like [Tigriopus californicus]TRY63702.1 hypothetical protein TCAL_03611 [Tigriopus californicus]|eukprot:TCALIF_03611-PA protein Name:"Similar to RALGPS2 Ras-specific guanine nucleotide-releasing factor RalGPS2 (Macaca fascicularis)" AED:0.02 eAED:0.02 QI:390/1/1/1/0.75/0.6/5/2104/626